MRTLRGGLAPLLLLLPGGAWLVVFFAIPMAFMLVQSLQQGSFDRGYELTWNFGIYPEVIGQYWDLYVRSAVFALATTFVTLAVGYPVAYTIAFRGGRLKSALLLIVVLPFFVSFVIRIIAWQFILADDGIVLGGLKDIGLIPADTHVLSTPFAVVAGLTYDALPFMLLPLYVALQRIDRAQVEAAADLYASGAARFRSVILPLSAPGIYAGIVLVAITNIGDYLSASILGGPSTTMIGNIIQTQYVNNADYPIASALALILMVTLMVAMAIYARVFGTRTLQEHVT